MFELTFPERYINEAPYELAVICVGVALLNYVVERVIKYVKYGSFYGFIWKVIIQYNKSIIISFISISDMSLKKKLFKSII